MIRISDANKSLSGVVWKLNSTNSYWYVKI